MSVERPAGHTAAQAARQPQETASGHANGDDAHDDPTPTSEPQEPDDDGGGNDGNGQQDKTAEQKFREYVVRVAKTLLELGYPVIPLKGKDP
ncbi:hypothetical protein [Rhodoblastus sp.]|uniref:hypothetical protein n=1 Tax=Rhodoblastus sp. TaxID=1962975 RepID=UPI003F97B63A